MITESEAVCPGCQKVISPRESIVNGGWCDDCAALPIVGDLPPSHPSQGAREADAIASSCLLLIGLLWFAFVLGVISTLIVRAVFG